MIILSDILPVLAHFATAFTAPTFCRVQTLVAAAILTPGRHTIANLIRNLGPFASAEPGTYQRVLSAARWSAMELSCLLTRLILLRFCPEGKLVLLGDDTVDGHRGKRVQGKGRHRDPVRSTHTHTVWRYVWRHELLKRLDPRGLVDQLPTELREFLLDGLTPAA